MPSSFLLLAITSYQGNIVPSEAFKLYYYLDKDVDTETSSIINKTCYVCGKTAKSTDMLLRQKHLIHVIFVYRLQLWWILERCWKHVLMHSMEWSLWTHWLTAMFDLQMGDSGFWFSSGHRTCFYISIAWGWLPGKIACFLLFVVFKKLHNKHSLNMIHLLHVDWTCVFFCRIYKLWWMNVLDMWLENLIAQSLACTLVRCSSVIQIVGDLNLWSSIAYSRKLWLP